MAKNSIRDFSATAGSNTDIQSVNIDENCPASGINNAIRELMVDLKNVSTGAVNLETPAVDQLNFGDNAKAIFGAGNDLQIYHDGNNSVISDQGTGNLKLLATNFSMLDATNSELMMVATPDGSVDLYHNNSKKFETTSTGVSITGGFTATDGCTITTADNTAQLTLKSTDADGGRGPELLLTRDSSSPADGDAIGFISWTADNDAGADHAFCGIEVLATDVSDGSEDATWQLFTQVAGTSRSRFSATPTETVLNEDSVDLDFRVETDNQANTLVVEGSTDAVHFGKSTYNSAATDGATISAFAGNGQQFIVTSTTSGISASFNRNSSAGTIAVFRKDGSIVSAIGVDNNGDGVIDGGSSRAGIRFVSDSLTPRQDGSEADNVVDLGKSDARFDDVFATNGTIQTSDQNEKQNIASLTTAEMTAAKAISKLFKTFKWKSKVTAKGDAARTHAGVIAQEVQTAMADAGLDTTKYAFWCSDTWWEHSVDVPATDAAGLQEAKEAYTRIDTYQTADEAPEGATQRTRLGIRYPELLSFIGAATEQRLADIETRLTALEA